MSRSPMQGRPNTEADWFGNDATPLIAYVSSHPSLHKARLFACAYAGPPPTDRSVDRPMWRRALALAERYADGEANLLEMEAASDRAYDEAREHDEPVLGEPSFDIVAAAAEDLKYALRNIGEMARSYDPSLAREFRSENPAYLMGAEAWHSNCARLIRDVYVNPFQPVTVEPFWRTTEVLALARAIYDERAFVRMPELVPVLRRAGCDNAAFLDHCREAGKHVRGCWALDLLLGKD